MRSEEKQEIIRNPNDNDVISVRGNKAKKFPGNERYADIIREHVVRENSNQSIHLLLIL